MKINLTFLQILSFVLFLSFSNSICVECSSFPEIFDKNTISEYHKFYPNIDPNDNNGRLLHYISLCLSQASLIGSLFVIFQTRRRIKQNVNLSMGIRLPMYIAINNSLSCLSYFANSVGALIIGVPWTGQACIIYGFFDVFMISMRLFLVMIINSLIFACIGLPSYGPSKYWCWSSPGQWSLAISISSLISITALLCIICYSHIIYTIITIRRPDGNVGINDVQQKTATRKILAYTFNYLIQWTPTLPFIIGVASGNDPLWVYYLRILSINIGGITNAIQYICHEGFLSNSRALSHQISNSISNFNPSEQLSETSYNTKNSELPVLKKEKSFCASISFNNSLKHDSNVSNVGDKLDNINEMIDIEFGELRNLSVNNKYS
ncbi:putative g-protein coupled receptor 21 [Gigaspora margarita]|uniref:Putative g-protein coupled receptor 21 n=1 Tax=Gigaspora margarita TaxID=4874 RepID=A0A8H3X1I4_GIGMA|nr:putative g-protein coupled receptor 21 [Gigaspora margarita]